MSTKEAAGKTGANPKTSLRTFLRMMWLVLVLRKSTKDFYDSFHEDYDNLVEGQVESEDSVRFISDFCAKNKIVIHSLLECGCGTGEFSKRLLSLGASLHGVDFSSGQLKQLQLKGLTMSVTQGDIRSIPYAANTFEAVTSYQLLPHFPRTETMYFKEAYRVLKPGGVFFVDPLRARQKKPSILIRAITKILINFSRIDAWPNTPSVEYLSEQLRKNGFAVEVFTKSYEKEWTFIVGRKSP